MVTLLSLGALAACTAERPERVSTLRAAAEGDPVGLSRMGRYPFEGDFFPWATVSADLDGDGDQDVATVGRGSSFAPRLFVHWNDGDGVFDRSTGLETPGDAESVAAADLDGDGDQDLLVGVSWNGSGLVLYEGMGGGSFEPGVVVSTRAPLCIRAGDLSGDGVPDVAVLVRAGSGLSEARDLLVLHNRGDGTFQLVRTVSHPPDAGAQQVDLADIDGDGWVDVLTTLRGRGEIELRRGSAGGLAATGEPFPTGDGPHAVRAGDMNGDGRPDAVVSHLGGAISVSLWGADGTFGAARRVSATVQPVALDLADLDDDGDLDVVASDDLRDLVTLAFNDGTGTLHETRRLAVGPRPGAVGAADFDGDGLVDVAAASKVAGATSFLNVVRNLGRGRWGAPMGEAAPDAVIAVASGDPDHDGQRDLLVHSYVYSSSGRRLFRPGRRWTLLVQEPVPPNAVFNEISVVSGDLDRDGLDDLAYTRFWGGNIWTHVAGASPPDTWSYQSQGNGYWVTAADLDGDRAADLVLSEGHGLYVFRNGGTAQSFTGLPAIDDTLHLQRPELTVVVAHFDGDGVLDLAVANELEQLEIRLGNGDGTFRAATSSEPTPGTPVKLIGGDFDRDGHEDVAALTFDDVLVALGDGAGGLGAVARYAAGAVPHAIAAGDLDADGDLDLVVANDPDNQLGSGVSFLTNDGAGRFGAPVLHPVGWGPRALDVADFDGNGRVDVAIGHLWGHSVAILYNEEGSSPVDAGAPDAAVPPDAGRPEASAPEASAPVEASAPEASAPEASPPPEAGGQGGAGGSDTGDSSAPPSSGGRATGGAAVSSGGATPAPGSGGAPDAGTPVQTTSRSDESGCSCNLIRAGNPASGAFASLLSLLALALARRRRVRRSAVPPLAALLLLGCSCEEDARTGNDLRGAGGAQAAGGSAPDARAPEGTGGRSVAEASVDAAPEAIPPDAASDADAGAPDADVPNDARPDGAVDADVADAPSLDATPPDAPPPPPDAPVEAEAGSGLPPLRCRKVGDFEPGVTWFDPVELTRVGSLVYFVGTTSAMGRELWVTDGTAGGTRLVKDIRPGAEGASVSMLAEHRGVLYFAANDGINGHELWRSDGTDAGTYLVRNTTPGADGSGFQEMVSAGPYLYIHGSVSRQEAVLRTDGTVDGTVELLNAGPATGAILYESFVTLGDRLCFVHRTTADGPEVWCSDGTSAGTTLAFETGAAATSGSPHALTVHEGVLYFGAISVPGDGLYRWDGLAPTASLVTMVATPGREKRIAGMSVAAGRLYFRAEDGAPWVSDGTANGTYRIADLSPGSGSLSRFFTAVGTRVVFSETNFRGAEPHVTDGTEAGTFVLRDIAPGFDHSNPTFFEVLEDRLYFAATGPAEGRELWQTDGTPEGTKVAFDLAYGKASSGPATMVRLGDVLLFSANDGVTGRELWRCAHEEGPSDPDLFDPSAPCPGTAGPSMVRFGVFCIDSTEVTNAQYAEFLAASPTGPPVRALCASNGSLTPACGFAPVTQPDHPVVCVDLCDAEAYCSWAGKRLCGAVGGDAIPLNGMGQWVAACSDYGDRDYPYGDVYDVGECADSQLSSGTDTALPVGGRCEGAVPGVYDLSGNVAEWTAPSPRSATTSADIRGGSFDSSGLAVTCTGVQSTVHTQTSEDVGFRCCAE